MGNNKYESIRLIDANKLCKQYITEYQHNKVVKNTKEKMAWQGAIQLLYDARTIDPDSLIPRGKWIKQQCQGDYGLCSECNCRIPWIPQNYNYCPSCGAKMDAEV